MNKIDYKKDYKEIYLPKEKPVIVNIPKIKYLTIEGMGNPNKEEFSKKTEALYAFSYAVKMSYKSTSVPDGYYEYTVFPLEGIWDLIDKSKPSTDKSNYKYKIMIRQPDFLTEDLFKVFISIIKNKKSNEYFDLLKLEEIDEGMCCQMLHIGSYDNEPASFKEMEEYVLENNYIRKSKMHREIYLSDPRKTSNDKLKTLLRFLVEEKDKL